MRLSFLQKYILKRCFLLGGRVGRGTLGWDTNPTLFIKERTRMMVSVKHPEKILTHSLESLIDKGLLRGYGRRTPKKWFLESVSLTKIGKVTALRCIGEQLPLLRDAKNK